MNRWGDIIEVPLPLPFALREIKAYVIEGSSGYTVIDTGLNTETDRDAWEQARRELGFDWTDVEQIVLTHYHPDHYGLAGTMQQWTDAPVRVSRTDFEQARLFWSEESEQPEILARFYGEHGLSSGWVEQIPPHLRGFRPWVEPHPRPSFIQAGETLRMGDRSYEVLHTPGHADGHLSFYDAERQWLIGGDFLLPKITPNISLWPGCDPNPLKTYLHTLKRLKELPVQKVFPSHGPVFDSYRERIEALEAHHQERLRVMREFLQKQPATSVEVCEATFGTELNIHHLRFALSETLAHLEYLVSEGHAYKRREGKVWRFSLA
ncbi:MBL fold metallo-hydrolase [Marinithermofilum abyssi]|uniref:MBL fold metallo-hydrolase n=1 Tax=Marinithermofilum abyssi TaxID=1571185 RepID=A0A8J2VFB0_9BACL|nr:MBL fold metallo-hydrolase [Marinithermofilum abyssi]GGE07059.1 MBL fold metallo-hydrolase [Marinithermofilum abyssi]